MLWTVWVLLHSRAHMPYVALNPTHPHPHPAEVYGFSSERKMASVLVRRNGALRLYNKGAAEMVLTKCTSMINQQGQTVPMTDVRLCGWGGVRWGPAAGNRAGLCMAALHRGCGALALGSLRMLHLLSHPLNSPQPTTPNPASRRCARSCLRR